MAKILAFETATIACSAALWTDGEVIERCDLAPRRHSQLLLPMIAELLQTASLNISDCDAIAFGNGPGSFMGLRIAAGVAQGLAFSAGLPVIPISTLQALAQMVYWDTQSSRVLVGWDARMQQIYWGLYQYDPQGGRMEPVHPDRLSLPAEITLISEDPCLAVGNAWGLYDEALSTPIQQLSRSVKDYYPQAKAVAFLGNHKFQAGEVISPSEVELSYLRNKVVSN